MYIPEHNKLTDRTEILSFIESYPFANLISVVDGTPYATPLPFLIEEKDDQLYLIGHCAKANIHGEHLLDQTHLIVFQEPHAFVTDEDYIRPSVPTWNYVAIHAYGQATLIENEDEVISLMMQTMSRFDPGAIDRWPKLTERKQQSLLAGITCFRIQVTDLQAKYKLSQNKMKEERAKVAERLLQKETTTEQEIGHLMKRLEP